MVSAPSLAGLLSLNPNEASADAGARLLRSLALGTEVELQLGRRLTAALSHRMLADAGDPSGTEMRLTAAVSRKMRVVFELKGLTLAPSLLLQYSSEGMPSN